MDADQATAAVIAVVDDDASIRDALAEYPGDQGCDVRTAESAAACDRLLDGAPDLAILRQVAGYDAFDVDNDPYGERDFGAFDYGGTRVFRKIDAYDLAPLYGSSDAAGPAVATRVLTVMLAEEY